MARIPKRAVKIAQELRSGQRPRRFRVRAILKWFGASRRGSSILSEIQATLANVGLGTEPALNDAGIDDQVHFVSLSQNEPANVSDDTEGDPASDGGVEIVTTSTNGNGQLGSEAYEASDELEADQEEEQPSSKPDDRPVTSQSSDWTISSLRDKLDRGQLDLQPKFQREYVWNTKPELPSRLMLIRSLTEQSSSPAFLNTNSARNYLNNQTRVSYAKTRFTHSMIALSITSSPTVRVQDGARKRPTRS